MNALSILHMCCCHAFSIASVSIHVLIANSVLSWSLAVASCRIRTHAFQSSIARRYSAQTVSFPPMPSKCACECKGSNDAPGNRIEYYKLSELFRAFVGQASKVRTFDGSITKKSECLQFAA